MLWKMGAMLKQLCWPEWGTPWQQLTKNCPKDESGGGESESKWQVAFAVKPWAHRLVFLLLSTTHTRAFVWVSILSRALLRVCISPSQKLLHHCHCCCNPSYAGLLRTAATCWHRRVLLCHLLAAQTLFNGTMVQYYLRIINFQTSNDYLSEI